MLAKIHQRLMRHQREIDAIFGRREPLNDGDFYAKHFPMRDVAEEVVSGVRQELLALRGLPIPVDMRLVQPEDRFAAALQFDSLLDVELLCAIERRFAVSLTDADIRTVVTVADLMRLVDRNLKRG